MSRRPRVLIPRPADQATALASRLQVLGLDPVVVPTVAVLPPASWDKTDEAWRRLGEYDWILFTSANGVRLFFHRRRSLGITALPSHLRWAAIGPGTAAALARAGFSGAWVPSKYLGEAVGKELPATPGQRVLRVRGETASPSATAALRVRGINVDEVIVYRTVEAPSESDGLLQRAWNDGIDAIIFTSASTVRGFAQLAARIHIDDDLSGIPIFAIGPMTADAAAARGWQVDTVAAQYSLDGIIQAIAGRRDAIVTGQAPS